MQLTHFPSRIIAAYLVTRGFGKWRSDNTKTAADWWVSFKALPDDGDRAIAVMDTDAKEDWREHRTGEWAEFPGIQILMRAKTDAEVEAKAKLITDWIDHDVPCQVIVLDDSTYRLSNFSRRGRFQFVKEEERLKRRLYSLNGFVTLTED